MKEEKNFIDFILKARREPQLTKEFLSIRSAKKLREFFIAKGFKNITEEDCKKLIKVTKGIKPLKLEDAAPAMYAESRTGKIKT